MSIFEVIQADTGKLTRIKFVPDGQVRIYQSHTYSYEYVVNELKKFSEPYFTKREQKKYFLKDYNN